MSWVARTIFVLTLGLLPAVAAAQQDDNPALDIFAPGLVAPVEDFGKSPPQDEIGAPIPYMPTESPKPQAPMPGGEHRVTLEARLVDGAAPLGDGVIWRVFGVQPGEDGELPLITTSRGGSASIALHSGDYLVHAAFGRAGATKRVTVLHDQQVGIARAGRRRPEARRHRRRRRANPPRPPLLRDPAGECRRRPRHRRPAGDAGAGAQAFRRHLSRHQPLRRDQRRGQGRHRGGGRQADRGRDAACRRRGDAEARLGGRRRSARQHQLDGITEAGATVHESVGAFPSLILAEGNYTAVADHQGKIDSRDFTIEPGVDRDIECASPISCPPRRPGGQPFRSPAASLWSRRPQIGRQRFGGESLQRQRRGSKVSCSLPPSRRSETVPSSASRLPNDEHQRHLGEECSRTL